MANRLKTWSAEVLTSADLNAEFDNPYAGTISRTAGYWGHNDDIPEHFGSSQDAQLEWNTDQTTDSLSLGLGAGNMFLIGEKADMATNYAIASQTNPTLIVHSADSSTAKDYIWLAHDQTDGRINIGAGGLKIDLDGTTKLTMASTGDLTVAEDLIVSGTGPHAVGSAVQDNVQINVSGAFTSGGAESSVHGVRIRMDLTGAAGDTSSAALLAAGGSLGASITTQGQTETVVDVATALFYEPNVTVGSGDTVTNAATVAIKNAPTEATNNYALLVNANGAVLGSTDAIQWLVRGHSTQTNDIFAVEDNSANKLMRAIHNPSANDGGILIKASATDHAALELDTQASPTAGLLHMKVNGTTASAFVLTATSSNLIIHARDFGNDVAGTSIALNPNNSASTEGPAAPTINFKEADGTAGFVWKDAAGDMRVHTAAPTGSSGSPTVSDTAGTVIGTQTSRAELKNIIGPGVSPDDALQAMLTTDVERFTYKSGRFNGEEFNGLVIRTGDEWFAADQGKVLDPVSTVGYTVQAIKALESRLSALEGKAN